MTSLHSHTARASGADSRRMATLAAGDLLVFAHGAGFPSDQDWNAAIEALRRGGPARMKVLVLTEGGGPSPAQQARLASLLRSEGAPKLAVVSDAVAIRFMASAMAFFIRGIRTFPRADLGAALTFLGVTAAQREAAEQFAASVSAQQR